MRAGRTVASVLPSEVTARELAELMVGSELPRPETRESTVTDVVELEVAGLTVVEDVRALLDQRVAHSASRRGRRHRRRRGQRPDASSSRRSSGSGARRPGASRSVASTSATRGTRARREHGVGYIPEDRQHDGLLLSSPLWENSMLGHQGQAPYREGPVDRPPRRPRSAPRRSSTSSTCARPGVDVAAYALSGGNQQKLIVGREMIGRTRSVLIASHPTRGIDVGAQAAVWEGIRRPGAAGLAVLLVSADLEELIGLSDTLLVDPTRPHRRHPRPGHRHAASSSAPT